MSDNGIRRSRFGLRDQKPPKIGEPMVPRCGSCIHWTAHIVTRVLPEVLNENHDVILAERTSVFENGYGSCELLGGTPKEWQVCNHHR